MFKKKKSTTPDMEETKHDTQENTEQNDTTVQNATEEETTTPISETAEVTAEEKLQAEVAQLNDKYLRLFAEFDNYKRRTTKERIELLQTAGKEVIVSMLPVLDDLDRALKAMETASDINAVKEGIILVQNKLKNTLAQKGLKEIESKGTTFDTDLHEAITNIPAPTEDMKGKVIDELEKGYSLNDKVVRFAKVVVGN